MWLCDGSKASGILRLTADNVTDSHYPLPMSWFANFKANRAAKRAAKEHTALQTAWQEDVDCLRKIIDAITAARCYTAGANVMVAGSFTFRAPDMAAAVMAIRNA